MRIYLRVGNLHSASLITGISSEKRDRERSMILIRRIKGGTKAVSTMEGRSGLVQGLLRIHNI